MIKEIIKFFIEIIKEKCELQKKSKYEYYISEQKDDFKGFWFPPVPAEQKAITERKLISLSKTDYGNIPVKTNTPVRMKISLRKSDYDIQVKEKDAWTYNDLL
jgi:hypothetical protein